MAEKNLTDIMLDRFKYFINSINNGEYEPIGYEFTVTVQLSGQRTSGNFPKVTFSDDSLKLI